MGEGGVSRTEDGGGGIIPWGRMRVGGVMLEVFEGGGCMWWWWWCRAGGESGRRTVAAVRVCVVGWGGLLYGMGWEGGERMGWRWPVLCCVLCVVVWCMGMYGCVWCMGVYGSVWK